MVIPSDAGRVDCVVRFHDPRRLDELARCAFSLAGQSYAPVHIILVLQRFSERDISAVRERIDPLLAVPGSPTLEIVNWTEATPRDGRTALLSLGLATARGRYVAFLDYDDVIYPEAYEMLVGKLRESGSAIAFASVRALKGDVNPDFFYAVGRAIPPYHGNGLVDLFRGNFCPIHSYLIDRAVVPTDTLRFDIELTIEEDYDLLLNIVARHRSNFDLIGVEIGDYVFKSDGSNSWAAGSVMSETQRRDYALVLLKIEARRNTTPLAPGVQASLGLPSTGAPHTIRSALTALGG